MFINNNVLYSLSIQITKEYFKVFKKRKINLKMTAEHLLQFFFITIVIYEIGWFDMQITQRYTTIEVTLHNELSWYFINYHDCGLIVNI